VPVPLIVLILLGAALCVGAVVVIARRRRAQAFPVLVAAFGLGLAIATPVTWALLH
jgi:hypothetical protein